MFCCVKSFLARVLPCWEGCRAASHPLLNKKSARGMSRSCFLPFSAPQHPLRGRAGCSQLGFIPQLLPWGFRTLNPKPCSLPSNPLLREIPFQPCFHPTPSPFPPPGRDLKPAASPREAPAHRLCSPQQFISHSKLCGAGLLILSPGALREQRLSLAGWVGHAALCRGEKKGERAWRERGSTSFAS